MTPHRLSWTKSHAVTAAVTRLLLSTFLPAQDAPIHGAAETLATTQVLARMAAMDEKRAAAQESYTCTRRYSIENKRFKIAAEMTIRMTYRRPGHKEFHILSESGSGAIRKRVLHKMIESELEASRDDMRAQTQITPANYDFRLTGVDMDQGRRVYVFEAAPKLQNKFMIRGRIWVDAEDFAITRIEGSPAKSPSFWVQRTSFVHRYRKFGSFWLAVSNRAESEVLIFGHTEVKIDYSDYEIEELRTRQYPVGSAGFAGRPRSAAWLAV